VSIIFDLAEGLFGRVLEGGPNQVEFLLVENQQERGVQASGCLDFVEEPSGFPAVEHLGGAESRIGFMDTGLDAVGATGTEGGLGGSAEMGATENIGDGFGSVDEIFVAETAKSGLAGLLAVLVGVSTNLQSLLQGFLLGFAGNLPAVVVFATGFVAIITIANCKKQNILIFNHIIL